MKIRRSEPLDCHSAGAIPTKMRIAGLDFRGQPVHAIIASIKIHGAWRANSSGIPRATPHKDGGCPMMSIESVIARITRGNDTLFW
jgi:hypothetical protein